MMFGQLIAIWKKIKFDYYLMSYSPVAKFQIDQQFKHNKIIQGTEKGVKVLYVNLGVAKAS